MDTDSTNPYAIEEQHTRDQLLQALSDKESRAHPTPWTILSVNKAVKHMHGRDSMCRALLKEWGLIHHYGGVRVVIWGDVLNKIRGV